jgi:hypothetical protein
VVVAIVGVAITVAVGFGVVIAVTCLSMCLVKHY